MAEMLVPSNPLIGLEGMEQSDLKSEHLSQKGETGGKRGSK